MSQSQTLEEVMQRLRAQVGGLPKPPAKGQERTQVKDIESSAVINGAGQDSGSPQEARSVQRPFSLKLHETSQLRVEIGTALDGTRKVGQINPRNPGLINGAIQFVKKLMRRSLTWYTRPLHQCLGGIVRALDQIGAILDNHNDSFRRVTAEAAQRHAEFEQKMNSFEQRLASFQHDAASLEQRTEFVEQKALSLDGKLEEAVHLLEAKLDEAAAAHRAALTTELSPRSQQIASLAMELESLREEVHQTRSELREADSRSRMRDRDVRRGLFAIQSGPAPAGERQKPTPPMFASEIKSDEEFDYFAFEDLYRGEESDIRSRQHAYLEYFRGRENVVDIGCGRGEFLELLRDNQISARGVEPGLDQYLLCREKGLEVVQLDLFTFLESLPDESLGGVFSAQVIEHLTASDQLRYVALAYRKTQPGSPVIFETINAQCVYAMMRNFFLDPTHVRPMHPETLKFAMETMQFKNVELRFSGPVSDKQIPPLQLNGDTPQLAAFNRSMQQLNDLIYGYQDYAAIGWH